MPEHEFLTTYQAKALEYLIAVAYLLAFVPFWRFVSGGQQAEPLRHALGAARRPASWFSLPEGLRFHPGHAWLRADGDVVTVGLDDFAQKLVGPLKRVELPSPGAALRQGERAFTLCADSKSVDMLSPLEGSVLAVNEHVATAPDALSADPYGRGWLLKVRPARLEADLKQLLAGELARKWLEAVSESLRARLSPEVGLVLQDGGQPVQGIARELDPERWDELVRSYFLS